MSRLARHYRATSARFWREAFARRGLRAHQQRLTRAGWPPRLGAALAYQLARATGYDEARMNQLLTTARLLAGA